MSSPDVPREPLEGAEVPSGTTGRGQAPDAAGGRTAAQDDVVEQAARAILAGLKAKDRRDCEEMVRSGITPNRVRPDWRVESWTAARALADADLLRDDAADEWRAELVAIVRAVREQNDRLTRERDEARDRLRLAGCFRTEHPDGWEEATEVEPSEHEYRISELVERVSDLEADNARQAALLQAIKDCRDDPGRAILQADRLAGEAIIRAERAERERDEWREKAQESGKAYADANTKHHQEWDRADRLERLAVALAERAVDLEDRARAAEAERDDLLEMKARVEALADDPRNAMDLWWKVTGDDWPVPEALPAKFLRAAMRGES